MMVFLPLIFFRRTISEIGYKTKANAVCGRGGFIFGAFSTFWLEILSTLSP
jgi:hypothetical protein